MAKSILKPSCSESQKAEAAEAKLVRDFLEELAAIADKFCWMVDRKCGIRGTHIEFAGWFCPMGAIHAARHGFRDRMRGPGHLLKLHQFYGGEMKMGKISAKLADAIDEPWRERNDKLARAICKAVGLDPDKALDLAHRRWG